MSEWLMQISHKMIKKTGLVRKYWFKLQSLAKLFNLKLMIFFSILEYVD